MIIYFVFILKSNLFVLSFSLSFFLFFSLTGQERPSLDKINVTENGKIMLRSCHATAPSMLTRAPTRTSRHRRESTLKGPCRGNRNLICFTIRFLSKQLLRFTPHAHLLPDPLFLLHDASAFNGITYFFFPLQKSVTLILSYLVRIFYLKRVLYNSDSTTLRKPNTDNSKDAVSVPMQQTTQIIVSSPEGPSEAFYVYRFYFHRLACTHPHSLLPRRFVPSLLRLSILFLF